MAEYQSVHNFVDAKSRAEFRQWLSAHHAAESECWVVVKRGKPTADTSTFWYVDAVEEALCFGWIDSTCKRLSETVTAQRFSPRSAKGNWTELNKERCRRLERLGLMTDAGRAVLPDMSAESFVIRTPILERLQADEVLWEHFCQLPDLYKRVRIDTIQFYEKRDKAVYISRLERFIENTRQGVLYGEWHDNGRLLQE